MARKGDAVFSISAVLQQGWDQTWAHWKPLLVIGAVGAFFALVNQALTEQGATHGAGGLLVLVLQLIQTAVMLVYVRAALTLIDRQLLDLSRPAELLVGYWRFLLVSVLYALIVAGGLVLLVVPGVVWAIKYAFAGFLVVDRRLSVVDALRESGRLTHGVRLHLLGFGLVAWLLNVLGALALGVGLLVTVPTTTIAAAGVLRALQAAAARRAESVTPAPSASMASEESSQPVPD